MKSVLKAVTAGQNTIVRVGSTTVEDFSESEVLDMTDAMNEDMGII